MYAFGTSQNGNSLALTCRPGKDEIAIRFTSDDYRYYQNIYGAWQARADSRFSKASEPDRDAWQFSDSMMTYWGPSRKGVFGSNKSTATFIDSLARDDSFSIRYEARQGVVETATIEYAIDHVSLGTFIAKCNPRRVIRYLREWNSPAAPPE